MQGIGVLVEIIEQRKLDFIYRIYRYYFNLMFYKKVLCDGI